MEFNVSKCKVMHMGHANQKHDYYMSGQQLEKSEEERDIGVMITSNLKPSAQCAKAARTAQGVLGQITRAFHYRGRHVFMRLYKQYVRPHLEFSTQAWSPWTEADKSCLEKVQQRAVRQVSGLTSTTYEGKLSNPGRKTTSSGHVYGTQRFQPQISVVFGQRICLTKIDLVAYSLLV